jgi:hypothetical protein
MLLSKRLIRIGIGLTDQEIDDLVAFLQTL